MIKQRGRKQSQVKLSGEKKATKKVKPPNYTETPPAGQDRYPGEVQNLAYDEFPTYLGLRQSIESLEYVAIFYYATAENAKERTDRQKELRNSIQSLTEKILKKSGYPEHGTRLGPTGPNEAPCPPGMKRCPSGECIAMCLPCVV